MKEPHKKGVNERQNIVRDDADRQRRLDWLRRAVEVFGCGFAANGSTAGAATSTSLIPA